MTHVTVPAESPVSQHDVVGSTTGPFAFNFTFFDDSDIYVVITTAGVDAALAQADFTVAGTAGTEGGYDGGTVTLDAAVANVTVTIYRDVPVERTDDFPVAGSFNITSLNTGLDKVWAVFQQLNDAIRRSLVLPITSTTRDLTIDEEPEADAVLAWNDDGDGIVNGPTIDEIEEAAANAAAAAASASTASSAASAAAASAAAAAASAASAAAIVGGGTVKVSAADTTADYLNSTLTSSDSSLTQAIVNPAGNETLSLTTTKASTTEILTGTNAVKTVTADALAALWEQGADIASAGTIAVGEGGHFHVTGTTAITDIDFATDKAGRKVTLTFDGVLTLTHNATTLILPGGANITTAAGDSATFVSEGSDNVRCVSYTKAAGTAVVGAAGQTLKRMTVFTASGTWTLGASVQTVKVRAVGAGGGGGSGIGSGAGAAGTGGGGGGGAYVEVVKARASLGATETVTIGTGGAAGTGSAGTAGGDTSFGAHLVADGGTQGGNGAAGGIGTDGVGGLIANCTGDVKIAGPGPRSQIKGGGTTNPFCYGGQGLQTKFGDYGKGGNGGNSATTARNNGIAGSDGYLVVEEYE